MSDAYWTYNKEGNPDDPYEPRRDWDAVARQAYITLPCPGVAGDLDMGDSSRSNAELNSSYHHQAQFSFFSIGDPASLVLTDEQKLRCRRGLKILKLTPKFEHTRIRSLDRNQAHPVPEKNLSESQMRNAIH
jgi:hypothetical protein